MADYPDKSTDRYVRESTYRVEPAAEGTGGLWFIVGGVIVALLVLFAIFFAPGNDGVTTKPAAPAVTIENQAAPPVADPAAPPAADPNAVAPEAAPVAPPADTEVAPAPADEPAAPPAGN